jgi:hypothetical protein
VLRHPGVVHGDDAVAAEVRLLVRQRPRIEQQVRRDPVLVLRDRHPQLPQRLDHFDLDRPHAHVHPVGPEALRRPHGALLPLVHHAEGGIEHAQVRVKAHRQGEVHLAVPAVAVEEVPVVEVPVGREHGVDRIGRLVDQVVVGWRQHRSGPLREVAPTLPTLAPACHLCAQDASDDS